MLSTLDLIIYLLISLALLLVSVRWDVKIAAAMSSRMASRA